VVSLNGVDEQVDEASKRRLVGAAVLGLAAILVLPRVITLPPPVEEAAHPDLPAVPASGHQGRVRPLVPPEPVVAAGTQPQNMLPLPDPVAEPTSPGDEVPRSEVPVETAGTASAVDAYQPRTGVTGWVVQVGSFSSKENADRLVEELRGRGFQGFAEISDVQGKKIYRVLVGPEVQKAGAEQARQRLDPWIRERKLNGQVRSYP
jgi:DedD protein